MKFGFGVACSFFFSILKCIHVNFSIGCNKKKNDLDEAGNPLSSYGTFQADK